MLLKTLDKCVFSRSWLLNPLYKKWLGEVSGAKHKARCILCMKDVDISSVGESALTSHMIGKKHKRFASLEKSLVSMKGFFGISSQQPATASDNAKEAPKSASSVETVVC